MHIKDQIGASKVQNMACRAAVVLPCVLDNYFGQLLPEGLRVGLFGILISVFKMNYVNMVKSMVKSGQNYLRNYGKNKAATKIFKSEVVLAARCFNDNQIDARKCQRLLTELIYLLNQGEHFSEDEIIQLFFSITKLFKWPTPELRRMIYQIIKELRNQPSIYIVTSCLVKDIQDKDNYFKMNALRTIHLVLDPSNLVQIERYIKTLIASDNPGVSCAALLSGIQLFAQHEEMVRKWTNEVSEKLGSKEQATKFHALMLLYEIKKKDSNAFKKVLNTLIKESLPELATVQLIRIVREYVEDIDHSSDEAAAIINFVSRQVRSTYPSVVLEAAKLACESSLMSNKDLLDVVKILEAYLVTTNTVKKYSVLKLYNKLLKNPSRRSLMVNISEIEKVLSDKNRSLSSLAASILLRMCNEAQLEKLFTQISESMGEMSDDYKIDVLGSIKNVIKQFPSKYQLVNAFLLRFMHIEKQYEFTKTAVEVMEFEIKTIGGEAKKECLRILSEFLMSLSFEKIHFQILGIISREVNAQEIDDGFLKHLIAQIYLQDAPVRACSLSTLIKLSRFESQQKASIDKVIKVFAHDEDEEVRFRSVVQTPAETASAYELDLLEAYLQQNCVEIQGSSDREALDWDKIRAWGDHIGIDNIVKPSGDLEKKKAEQVENEEESRFRDIFKSHTTFSKYGPMLKVCSPVLLTERDAEFEVRLRKFFFKENILLEYTVSNHTQHSTMEDVKVELKHNSEDLALIHMIPAKEIKPNTTSDVFLGLSCNTEEQFISATFSSVMKYKVRETQGSKTTSYDDEYPLEEFNLTFTDYMSPSHLPKGSFSSTWEAHPAKEQVATFQLNYPNTQAAAKELQKHFGLAVCEGEQEDSKKSNLHVCYLSGNYLGKEPVLVICMIGFDTKKGCLLKLRVKCKDDEVAESVLNSIE